ncbi:MAG TPA: hypothetical protein VNG12_10840 [Acidimicrobiales bacterium]|nr:hypothetical protein [Acidimicrobiales bacterium]
MSRHRFRDEEPDFGETEEQIEMLIDAESGCGFCGLNHPTKDCPHNPDSHIRKMVRPATDERGEG